MASQALQRHLGWRARKAAWANSRELMVGVVFRVWETFPFWDIRGVSLHLHKDKKKYCVEIIFNRKFHIGLKQGCIRNINFQGTRVVEKKWSSQSDYVHICRLIMTVHFIIQFQLYAMDQHANLFMGNTSLVMLITLFLLSGCQSVK